MADLIVRPSGLKAPKDYVLQLRMHESLGEVEYDDICLISLETARRIVRAGPAFFLLGDPEDKLK